MNREEAEKLAREWLCRVDSRFASETFQPNDVWSLANLLQREVSALEERRRG